MKFSKNEQELIEYVLVNAARYGSVGPGDLNPKTRKGKRTLKLLEAGVILYVGCGAPSKNYPGSYEGGSGLITAEMFDPAKHTKLSPK